ncbi:MAG: SPW repeat domain-containing protein [Persicimonas sp.]
MRFIPTNIHAILDYVIGAALILAPFVLGFDTGGAAMWVPIIIGAGIIAYSLFTRYEYSISNNIDMRTHLGLDALAGVVLAVSPWVFGFSELVWAPHLIVGLFEIGTALTTRLESRPRGTSRRGVGREERTAA